MSETMERAFYKLVTDLKSHPLKGWYSPFKKKSKSKSLHPNTHLTLNQLDMDKLNNTLTASTVPHENGFLGPFWQFSSVLGIWLLSGPLILLLGPSNLVLPPPPPQK
jgi:hypothetical protein